MENKLPTLIKASGLDKTKSQVLLDNFQDYFKIASEWEIKARAINVTDESQTADMKMARVGRLFLKDKRVSIERQRKELKEQSLREGKAIDGIANVLKALLIPIEEHLEKQEKFIEIKQAEETEKKRLKDEQDRIDAEIKAEEERVKKEKAEAEAKVEKEKKEFEAKVEKEKADAKAKADKWQAKIKKELEEAEEKAKKLKADAEEKLKAEKEKKEKAKKEYEEKIKKAEEENKKRLLELAEEKDKAEKARIAYEESLITCPFCKKVFPPEKKED